LIRNFYSNVPTAKERLTAKESTKSRTQLFLKDEADRRRREAQAPDSGENVESDDSDDMDTYAQATTDSSHGDNGFAKALQDDEFVLTYEPFAEALQDCPMILGFHAVMTHANANACCYCPCARKLQPWRACHNIHDKYYQCGSNPFTPSGLVAHLNQLQTNASANNPLAMFHWIALRYVRQLYGNYWGPGVPHKGLCNMNDREYRAAEAKEKSHDLAYVFHRWCT
jgi:hypothetical protein